MNKISVAQVARDVEATLRVADEIKPPKMTSPFALGYKDKFTYAGSLDQALQEALKLSQKQSAQSMPVVVWELRHQAVWVKVASVKAL